MKWCQGIQRLSGMLLMLEEAFKALKRCMIFHQPLTVKDWISRHLRRRSSTCWDKTGLDKSLEGDDLAILVFKIWLLETTSTRVWNNEPFPAGLHQCLTFGFISIRTRTSAMIGISTPLRLDFHQSVRNTQPVRTGNGVIAIVHLGC